MPDSVFTYRMPAGIPGDVSRFSVYGTTVKAENQNLTTPVTTYGQVCTIDTNGARPLAAGDTAAPAIIGFSVRPFPGSDYTVALPATNPGTVPFGAGTPPTKGVIDLMYRGYMTVKLNGAAAAVKGGAVYAYYNTSTGNHVQAGVEAAAGANLWQIPDCYFVGPADSAGNVEIAFNIQ
jgi:hypothetical protein